MRKTVILVWTGAAIVMSSSASAHTKWFNPNYCVSDIPTPLASVVDAQWLEFLALFVVAGMFAHMVDRLLPASFDCLVTEGIAALSISPKDWMRIGLGVFYLCLWDRGGIILTPELTTTSGAISWFQLLLAISTLSWRTTPFAAFGTCALYAYALLHYGLFHMLDYPFFLGIAAYLALHSLRAEAWTRFATPTLITSLAASMLWASIEKWAYWFWTMPILANHEEVTFGFDHQTFIKLAGFCEFSLAFFLLSGRLFMRLAAVALLAIFSLAIMSFGKIDAVGHLLIVLSLIVAVIEGEQPLNRLLGHRRLSLLSGTAVQAVGYLLVLGLFLGGYYGIHATLYDDGIETASRSNASGKLVQAKSSNIYSEIRLQDKKTQQNVGVNQNK